MLTPWFWYRPYGRVSCEYAMMSDTLSGKKWLSSRQVARNTFFSTSALSITLSFHRQGATSPRVSAEPPPCMPLKNCDDHFQPSACSLANGVCRRLLEGVVRIRAGVSWLDLIGPDTSSGAPKSKKQFLLWLVSR